MYATESTFTSRKYLYTAPRPVSFFDSLAVDQKLSLTTDLHAHVIASYTCTCSIQVHVKEMVSTTFGYYCCNIALWKQHNTTPPKADIFKDKRDTFAQIRWTWSETPGLWQKPTSLAWKYETYALRTEATWLMTRHYKARHYVISD